MFEAHKKQDKRLRKHGPQTNADTLRQLQMISFRPIVKDTHKDDNQLLWRILFEGNLLR